MAINLAVAAPKRKNQLIDKFLPHLSVAAIYAILLAGAVMVFFPFAWTISTSLKTEQQTLEYPPTWIPDPGAVGELPGRADRPALRPLLR